MKTPEDEAFDELARRQGAWGGGFQAKRQAAMDKINSHFDAAYKKMHEDRAMYGTSWSKDGERIDPTSVYLEQPAHCQCFACKDGVLHASDCAVHNGPAYPAGPCDCGVMNDRQRLEAIVSVINKYLPPFGMHIMDAMSAIISLVDPLPPQPAQEPDALTIAYQSGFYDGKKAALAGREWNFCERCGKRTADKTAIHTCTPPQGAA